MNFTPILSTGCLFHLPLEEIFFLAKESGFLGIELILNDPNLVNQSNLLTSLDKMLPILSLHAPFRNHSLWGGHLKAWEKTIDIAAKLPQVKNITFHPPVFRLGQIGHFWWFTKSKNLPKDLNSQVPLSLENMPCSEHNLITKKMISTYIKQCQDKNMKFTLDVCHLGISGGNILKVFDVIEWDIVNNIHFSDIKGFREHLFPGEGELPLQKFVTKLHKTSFNGLFTLEVSPATLPQKKTKIIKKLQFFLENFLPHT
ncbi:sugar phosphate isomerase/epimerase family protein [Desulfonauticus submarinus]